MELMTAVPLAGSGCVIVDLTLFPNGKIQNVLLKNFNYDGSLLVEKEGKEEKVFSARIINDFN